MAPGIGSLALLRRSLAAALSRTGLPDAVVGDVILAASELVTNATNASPAGEPVAVRVDMSDHRLVLEVENAGQPFFDDTLKRRAATSGDSAGGRGMVIVSAIADEVSLRFHRGRCVVTAVLTH